ncbi:hypothetical protein [Sulfurisphaera ohwakuensis]|uniref:hypothetical protein n=1 Tax=Sulfurisphaera ohwakuensis TaxID=69656 RepID=UPI0036F1DF6F
MTVKRIDMPKEWMDKSSTDEFILVLKDDRIELYLHVSNLTYSIVEPFLVI